MEYQGFSRKRCPLQANDDPALNELHDLNAEVLFKPIWLEEVLSVTRNLLAKRKPADPKPS